MQESGPVPPVDGVSDQSPLAGEAQENDSFSDQNEVASKENAPAKPPKPPKRPKRPQRPRDPVVGWLTLAIAGVVILWLVSMLSAILFGLLSPPVAPRTAAERDLMSLTATVQGGKANAQTYSQYVGTLISAGQLAKAQQSLDQALKITKSDKSYLYARQAELLLARKDYQGAVTAADKAMAEAEKEFKAFQDENVKNNRKPLAGAVMPRSYADAALAKAEALVASEDHASAIKVFDLYLKQAPADADILVMRAQAKVKVGDKEGAAADFNAALKYIPDYQPALDGLKQIGAAK